MNSIKSKEASNYLASVPETQSVIVLVEDDPEQLLMLTALARDEIEQARNESGSSGGSSKMHKSIRILKLGDLASLKKACFSLSKPMHVVLDCNLPDSAGEAAHDQFVKQGHRITGQHRAVDLITQYWPDTPITLISSRDRFQKLVTQFYAQNRNLNLKFVSKRDPERIGRSIRRAISSLT